MTTSRTQGVSPVQSVFSRTGDVAAAASDYAASQIDNDSDVAGATVADALDAAAATSLLSSQTGTGVSLTYTVPANSMVDDNDGLFFFGTWSYSSGSPTMTMRFGGTAFMAYPDLSASGGLFWGTIHRIGASSQACAGEVISGSLAGGDHVEMSHAWSSNRDLFVGMTAGSVVRSLVVMKYKV